MKTATLNAIKVLQRAVTKRFGKKVDTSAGASTLYINHDHVELTDGEGTIVQRGPVRVATILRRKRRTK